MQKVRNYKCPHCGVKYKSLQTWGNHVRDKHPDLIPKGWSYARYFYYVITGKKCGYCINCKTETEWNEATQKYERFCKNPKCKEQYREMFKNRMIGKYGKVHLLNDPEQQRKMLAKKKISGEFTFRNGKKVTYTGTYELDFLNFLDRFLQFDGNDIMMPSPHTYYYEYKNDNDVEHEGKHFYIPDAYIPSIKLEIEIKQDTTTHPKILMIDKVKEREKDEMMRSQKGIHYIKINDKKYDEFIDLLANLSGPIDPESRVATESMIKFEKLTDGYEKKERLDLNSFKSGKLNRLLIAAFKRECPNLSHVATGPNSKGELFIDGKKVVGYYNTTVSENCVWLQALEITPEYRGHGLGSQLLKRAIRKGKVTNLSVNIKNELAINLYQSYGFTEYSRNLHMIFMMLP